MRAKKFDPSKIQEIGLKQMYDFLLVRGDEVVHSLLNIYQQGKNHPKVAFSYQFSTEFNAVALWSRNQYNIQIDSPTVFLTRNLFDALFSYEGLLPEIKSIGNEPEKLTYSFCVDPLDLNKQVPIEYAADRDRIHASYVLADLCTTFVLLHEIGHVACGHVQGIRHYFNKNQSPKFIQFFGLFGRGAYLRRSMEYDADVVASVLLTQYIEHLESAIIEGKNQRLKEVFGVLQNNDGYMFERLVAIVNLSLYALFTYISGRDPYKFDKRSAYPHPLVRALYIKDILIGSLESRREFNKVILLNYNQYYFDQFDAALASLNLNQSNTIIENVMDHLDDYTEEVKSYASRFRRFTSKWTWIPIETWG